MNRVHHAPGRHVTGDRIVFPAGAVSAPTEIGMRADDTYQGVRLSPHGLTFPASAQPVLELRAVGEGAFRRQLTVVYVDDGDSILEVLPTDRHGNTLRVNLEHFSGYIVAGGRAESTRMP